MNRSVRLVGFLALAAVACDRTPIAGPIAGPNAVSATGAIAANVATGGVVQLSSPAEFSPTASTTTFEGLTSPSQNYYDVVAWPGVTIPDPNTLGVRVYDPIQIGASYLSFPAPSGTGMLVVFEPSEFLLTEPATEFGFFVSLCSVNVTSMVTEPIYWPLTLRAFDASGIEIGSV